MNRIIQKISIQWVPFKETLPKVGSFIVAKRSDETLRFMFGTFTEHGFACPDGTFITSLLHEQFVQSYVSDVFSEQTTVDSKTDKVVQEILDSIVP